MIETLELDNCKHSFIEINGFNTCKKCGIVNERIFANNSFLINENKNYNKREFKQSVMINSLLETTNSLRTNLSYSNSMYLRDIKGKLLNPNNQKLYLRLKKRHSHFNYTILQKNIRINLILINICKQLHIPKIVQKRSFYDYLILKKKTKIDNSVVCIFYCLWYNCKLHNANTSLVQLISTFKKSGHRVNKHLLVQANFKYNSFLNNENIVKNPLDYIPLLISNFSDNSNDIIKKFKFKDIICYKSFENYIFQLERISREIINKLSFQSKKHQFNPFVYTGSIFYFANLLLSIKNKHKRFISQKFISQITGIKEYSIRELYLIYLKKYLPKKL